MPPRAAPRRSPSPRKKIIWRRAAPVFIGMMALLIFMQQLVLPEGTIARQLTGSPWSEMVAWLQSSPLAGGGGFGLSLIAGVLGAFLISRYATVTPPPPPSKTQQRKLAAAAAHTDADDEEEEEEEADVPARTSSRRRRRRRR